MAAIGYMASSNWRSVTHGFSDAGHLLGGLAIFTIAFAIYHRYRSYKTASATVRRLRYKCPRAPCPARGTQSGKRLK
jgi:hypothetical protein